MIVKTNTYVCGKCKAIVDVITEFWTDVTTDESVIGKCPKCNSSEYLNFKLTENTA
jgi:DNA-directed RNA polymerase subunit RPC12/RpoP